MYKLAWWLLVIGGLNWLLVGLFNWSIGDVLPDMLARIVYILVGLSTVYLLAAKKPAMM